MSGLISTSASTTAPRAVVKSTVTSVLIPWNTCGAYQSSVLGVATGDYFMYAIFNWTSPLISMLLALTGWKITKISSDASKKS